MNFEFNKFSNTKYQIKFVNNFEFLLINMQGSIEPNLEAQPSLSLYFGKKN